MGDGQGGFATYFMSIVGKARKLGQCGIFTTVASVKRHECRASTPNISFRRALSGIGCKSKPL
jgi:hypothetical protein